jgi:hypothetical protein
MALLLSLFLTAQMIDMALPDGDNMWVVRVATTGGIVGTGIGNFSFSSEGKLACGREMQCVKEFRPADFHALIEVVQAGTLPATSSPVSLCNDCITRTITISRRDSMGVVHTFSASWDETTRSRLPAEVSRIYDAALALIYRK